MMNLKHVSLLACLLMAHAFGALAQNNHQLTLFSEDNQAFTLFINNVQQNEVPQSNVFVDGISSQVYSIRIDWQEGSLADFTKGLPIGNQNGPEHHTYIIKKNRQGKYVFRYQGGSPVETAAPVAQAAPAPAQQREEVSLNVNVGGEQISISASGVSSALGVNGGATESESPCSRPMKLNDFTSALLDLKEESFDTKRLDFAKTIVKNNCMSADQLVRVSETFVFDENRLAFLKYAYDFCTDRGNYWMLKDTFKFEMNWDNLESYIDQR